MNPMRAWPTPTVAAVAAAGPAFVRRRHEFLLAFLEQLCSLFIAQPKRSREQRRLTWRCARCHLGLCKRSSFAINHSHKAFVPKNQEKKDRRKNAEKKNGRADLQTQGCSHL